MPSPFEEGVAAGRRIMQDPAYASGAMYGLLQARGGQPAPDGATLRKPSPARRTVLKTMTGRGTMLLCDVEAAVAESGEPMGREALRETLKRLVRDGLVEKVPAVDRRTGRPAFGYQVP